LKWIKLLIDYANRNNIILELNKKNGNGGNPLLKANDNSNIFLIIIIVL